MSKHEVGAKTELLVFFLALIGLCAVVSWLNGGL